MNENKNTLYLCATPIGNLEDITFRAVRILKEVDIIAAEDTRHTRKLLSYFDIHTPLIRYDENNKTLVGEKIINRLISGENVACVSDAGLPAISDPGAELVQLAIEANIRVVPIPGANAALSALICSGLDTKSFTFIGFLPKTNRKSIDVLNNLKLREETLILYESPHHLKSTLNNLFDILGNRRIVLARELTKIHEEFIRSTLGEIKVNFSNLINLQGEFVIVVEGAIHNAGVEDLNLIEIYNKFIENGFDKKTAMRETAKKLNISRRDVYQSIIQN